MPKREDVRLMLDLLSTATMLFVAAALWLGAPKPSANSAPGGATAAADQKLVGLETDVPSSSLARGKPKLAIVEFSDFQCPFCAQSARELYPKIHDELVADGSVQYVFRHYPLDAIHPLAAKAGEAVECAGQQRKYWEMHARLFANQNTLGPSDLIGHAGALGLDRAAFRACLEKGDMQARVKKDKEEGDRLGVTGTPTLFLGELQPNGKIKLRKKLGGVVSFAALKTQLSELLPASIARR